MQYSSKQAISTEEDEDATTTLQYITNTNINLAQTVKAHTNYLVLLASTHLDLCIIDGGADSHIGGRTWLPLTPLSGPLVKYANVIGFDEKSAKKLGLPIIQAVTKVILPNRERMLLHAKQLIYN